MVFDVGVDYFFTDKRRKIAFSVVRAKERIRFPDRPDAVKPGYFFECLAFSSTEKSMHAYLAEFPHREPGEVVAHFHLGAEMLHVLEGKLVIRMEDEDHELAPGDTAYFDASEPHSYRGVSRKPARALVVTVPPGLEVLRARLTGPAPQYRLSLY